MQATIVVLGTFKDGYQSVFEEYSQKVRTFLASKGARTVRRQRIEKTLYGGLRPSLIMLIDFPSRQIAESCFFEPEYLSLIPLRDRVFSDFQMHLAESGEI